MERAFAPNRSKEDYMLYVNNLPDELNEEGIKQIFSYYGKVTALFFRRGITWAYVSYAIYQEAENAIKDLDDTPPLYLKVSFAKKKGGGKEETINMTTVESRRIEHNNCTLPNPMITSETCAPEIKSEMRLQLINNTMPVSEMPVLNYSSEDDLLYPYPTDSSTYNPYENAEPYMNTNTLWTRGQLTVSPDGKRHVSLGRGYTLYEIPDPHPEIHKQITKVYEKRHTGLFEYGKDALRHKIGKCQRCLKVTKYTCERCYGFYCSKDCQVSDWQRHKNECQAIPALIGTINSMSLSQPSNENLTHSAPAICTPLRRPKTNISLTEKHTGNSDVNTSPCTNKKAANKYNSLPQNEIGKSEFNEVCNRIERADFVADNRNVPQLWMSGETAQRLHKYNKEEKADKGFKRNEKNDKITDMEQAKVENTSSSSNKSFGIESPIFGNVKEFFQKFTEPTDTIDNKKRSVAKPEADVGTAKDQENFSVNDVPKMEEDIDFEQHTQLSKNKYTRVRIVVKCNDRDWWVQKVDDDTALAEMMASLQNAANGSKKVQPVIGNVYAVKYENIWHRALVTSLSPLKVHYIDYGNDENVEINDLREINAYKNIPRFSMKIRLSESARKEYKHLKYEDEIFVKMDSIDPDKVITVNIKDKNDESCNAKNDTSIQSVDKDISLNNSECNSIPQLPNVVDTLAFGEKGILEVHAELGNNAYSVTLLPSSLISDFESLLSTLPKVCMEATGYSNYRPSIGNLICGQRLDGQWLRGYVLSLKTPLKMAIVDEARMMTITNSIPCPKEFIKIPTFGAVCEITDAKQVLKSSDQCTFDVIARENNKKESKVEIEILMNGNKIRATVKSWAPLPEQQGVQFAELKSGSEVCLTSYRSQNLLYVRSLNITEVERYNNIMQKVAKCALSAKVLESSPVVGEMVMARYIDGNYYRAVVTKVQDEKVAISYVDFGNIEVTKRNKLYTLSNELKQVQSCAMKIVLKGIPQDTPMTKETADYLNYLVGREVPVVCTFEGEPSKDGVYLKLPTGESINEKISALLTPNWQAADEDKRCYMENDIEVASLGNVGDTVQVYVSHRMEDGLEYALCPLDRELMSHVYEIMPTMMKKYCESTDYYIPRKCELCLGMYNAEWYRAFCLNRNAATEDCELFFVDFGYIKKVDHKNIRYMPKDFITPKALASICKITNLITTNDKEYPAVLKRISELMVPNTFVKVKIVSKTLDGLYDIEVPEVRAKLIGEGLIKP